MAPTVGKKNAAFITSPAGSRPPVGAGDIRQCRASTREGQGRVGSAGITAGFDLKVMEFPL